MSPRLITIPISHFCEKARWALDRAGIAYTEEPHLQAIHIWHARRAGGGRTVPVLVTADGALTQSRAILAWADAHARRGTPLYPGEHAAQARRIEAWLDAGLGPDGRLWMYHQTLPTISDLSPWTLAGVPRWERWAFTAGHRVLDPFIRRYLGVDARAADAALVQADAVFDEVAALLADGRPFLTGDAFTAADLTFAALSAPLLIPENYGSPLPPPALLPASMQPVIARLRAHPAGSFAARLYRDERRPSAI